MRRILPFTLLALTLLGGTALADRGRYSRDTSHRSGGTVVRDHRHDGYRDTRVRVDRRYDRNNHRSRRAVVERRPVYVTNGRYTFTGGISRSYSRPVIQQRYYDYRYRPQLIIENYDPVPGYVWVQGAWNWNGYEWTWVAGHYHPDPSYGSQYSGSYNNGGYYDSGQYSGPYNGPSNGQYYGDGYQY
ncbi:MAG: hypothetical protein M3680_08805 [Myxococcota bacterium]|nr:hypothetical protein [Myxococcota bacterium]